MTKEAVKFSEALFGKGTKKEQKELREFSKKVDELLDSFEREDNEEQT